EPRHSLVRGHVQLRNREHCYTRIGRYLQRDAVLDWTAGWYLFRRNGWMLGFDTRRGDLLSAQLLRIAFQRRTHQYREIGAAVEQLQYNRFGEHGRRVRRRIRRDRRAAAFVARRYERRFRRSV